ncbi:50S ribosomal protein L11 methyltransferase [Bacteroidales bacterium OttesenSCG-928-I21]|nr:50S ribosomal protein L11 methyltransferase [Bacteroidales bacterium OttesenSCG-928-I21]
MNYIEVSIVIPTDKKFISEILVAFLAELGFDSFSEDNDILSAYIYESEFVLTKVETLMQEYNVDFSIKTIAQQNWNAEWEKNFEPIVVGNYLAIKAPFHKQDFDTKHTIIIEPKMSFGTGHHATTHLMCQLMAKYNFTDSSVLDMGCGTGILAIYAALLGAKNITAIDIDEWAYENTIENIERNNFIDIKTIKGDVSSIPSEEYNFVLANINLNILKNDIPRYSQHLKTDSYMFLSGFFASELPQISEICKNHNLSLKETIERENWIASVFCKTGS